MVARVVPQSARRRHAESRKPDLRGVVGHQRVAPPPAKKARFQPARGAVDAAAAVM